MIFMLLGFTSLLAAVVSGGGPAAYSISTSPADLGAVGATHENTVKSPGGVNTVSEYSKAVDTPHSSVRISSSRVTNNAFGYNAAPGLAYTYTASPNTKLTSGIAYGSTGQAAYGISAAPGIVASPYSNGIVYTTAPGIDIATSPTYTYGSGHTITTIPGISAAPSVTYKSGLLYGGGHTISAAPSIVPSTAVTYTTGHAAPGIKISSPTFTYGSGHAITTVPGIVTTPGIYNSGITYGAGHVISPASSIVTTPGIYNSGITYGTGHVISPASTIVTAPTTYNSGVTYGTGHVISAPPTIVTAPSIKISQASPLSYAAGRTVTAAVAPGIITTPNVRLATKPAVAVSPAAPGTSTVTFTGLGTSYTW